MSWPLGLVRCSSALVARRRLRLVRAHAPAARMVAAGGDARRARRARPRSRSRALPERQADHRHRAHRRLRARRRARLRRRRDRRRWPRTSSSARARGRRGRWPPGGSSASAAPRSARLSGRRLRRVPLALACARGGARGEVIMNVYTWTIGASHTLAALLAIAGTALPFDVADTIATLRCSASPSARRCARLLARTRDAHRRQLGARRAAAGRRGEVGPRTRDGRRPRRRSLALVVRRCCCARRSPRRSGVVVAAHPTADGRPRLASHASWHTCRPPRTPTAASAARAGQAPSSELYTAGRRSGSRPPGATRGRLRRDGRSVLDSLRGEAPTLRGRGDARAHDPRAARLRRLAVSLPGRDLVAECCARAQRDGSFDAPGQPHRVRDPRAARGRPRAAAAPRSARRPAGSRASRKPTAASASARAAARSDVDDTGAALQALASTRARATRGRRAAAGFLSRSQNRDGGFPQQPGGALERAVDRLGGPGPDRGRRQPRRACSRRGSRSPLGYLQSAAQRPTAACATRARAPRRPSG